MTISLLKPEVVDNLRAFFVGRAEPNYTWGTLLGGYSILPSIRLLYSFAAIGGSNNDLRNSIAGAPEMANNNAVLFQTNVAYANIFQYGIYAGTNQYFSQTSQADNRITADLSVFGWFYFNNTTSSYGLISKWVTAGDQRCYRLIRTSGNVLRFEISETGNSTTKTVDSAVVPSAGGWYFVLGTHELAGTSRLNIYVSNPATNKLVKTTNSTSIPNSFFDSATSALEIGRSNATDYLGGLSAFVGLASTSLGRLSDDRFPNVMFQSGRAFFGYT